MTMRRTQSAVTAALVAIATLSACAPNPLGHARHGDAAMDARDYYVAIEHYKEALNAMPGDADFRNRLGLAYMGAGKYADAVEPLRVAHDQVPTNRRYLDNLCDALHRAGRTEEAFRMLRGYAEFNGRPADWLQLGRFAARSGDPDTAKTALLTAARLDRGRSVEPQLALADLYIQVGDRVNAVRRVRMAYYLDRKEQDVLNRAKALGEPTGPTFGLQPTEQNEIVKTPDAPADEKK